MSLKYERLVTEDINQGYGTVQVTMPAGGSATGNKVGLHTFWRSPIYNLKDFGAAVDGLTDDTAAMVAAIAALPSTGGEIYIPAGTCVLRTLTTIAIDHVTISGAGWGLTTVTCPSTTGAFLVQADFCMFSDIGIHYTGAGGYGVKFFNGSVDPATGLFRPAMRNIKIKGGAGTSHGLWLVNCTRGSFLNVYAPCGGGDAVRLEAAAFHTFVDILVTVNFGENSPQWANGITLQEQSGNNDLQSDDNKFYNAVVEGVTAHGILITSLLGAPLFIAPARNAFHGGTSEGNGTADVTLENALNNSFYDFHCESSPKGFWIVGNTGNHVNNFTNCLGQLDIDNPPDPQGIQGITLTNHVGNVIVAGANVYGTQIFGVSGTVSDAGTDTFWKRTSLAASGSSVSEFYYGSRSFGTPRASLQTVQVSGGVFVNVIALPTGTAGRLIVWGKQNTTTNIALYEIGYVSGVGIDIGTPRTLATVGATSAQMTFQHAAGFLQAKGANAATPPDTVTVTIAEQWAIT